MCYVQTNIIILILYNVIMWMSFRGTRRTDGPDKPLDSSRDILCPTGRENITFPVLVFWHKATSIQFDGSHFFSFFLFFSPRIFMPGNRWLFFHRGFKGEFILSRPRRQISGIESLFSIRTPSLRTTFAPSSLVEIDIDDLNLRFSFGHASPPLHSFRSLSAKADRGTRADHNGG